MKNLILFVISLLPIIGLVFIYIQTPLRIGVLIIVLSFFVATIIFFIGPTSWFSYLLFIVFLRGIIIIFIYVSSLASNEILFYNIYFLPLFFVTPLLLFMYLKINFDTHTEIINSIIEPNSIFSYKIYTPYLRLLTRIIMIYLLIALLVVVKNSLFREGPLRKKR